MKAGKVILSGLIGTSVMTLYSYAVSKAKRKNFKEPELLAGFEEDAFPAKAKELALPAGWATHYSMGLAWVVAFHLLWENTSLKPSVKSGIVLGIISGTIGVAIWDALYKLHPDPPPTDNKRFYGQLLLAHVIYSVSATLTEKYMD